MAYFAFEKINAARNVKMVPKEKEHIFLTFSEK